MHSGDYAINAVTTPHRTPVHACSAPSHPRNGCMQCHAHITSRSERQPIVTMRVAHRDRVRAAWPGTHPHTNVYRRKPSAVRATAKPCTDDDDTQANGGTVTKAVNIGFYIKRNWYCAIRSALDIPPLEHWIRVSAFMSLYEWLEKTAGCVHLITIWDALRHPLDTHNAKTPKSTHKLTSTAISVHPPIYNAYTVRPTTSKTYYKHTFPLCRRLHSTLVSPHTLFALIARPRPQCRESPTRDAGRVASSIGAAAAAAPNHVTLRVQSP